MSDDSMFPAGEPRTINEVQHASVTILSVCTGHQVMDALTFLKRVEPLPLALAQWRVAAEITVGRAATRVTINELAAAKKKPADEATA